MNILIYLDLMVTFILMSKCSIMESRYNYRFVPMFHRISRLEIKSWTLSGTKWQQHGLKVIIHLARRWFQKNILVQSFLSIFLCKITRFWLHEKYHKIVTATGCKIEKQPLNDSQWPLFQRSFFTVYQCLFQFHLYPFSGLSIYGKDKTLMNKISVFIVIATFICA